MFGSEILETAIGLAFVYVLLSLACSVLTESIARVFNMRGATLKRAIRQMVYGVFTPGVTDVRFVPHLNQENSAGKERKADKTVDDFYDHGLIKPLYKSAFLLWKNTPSYIAPRTFALALVDKLLDYHAATAESEAQAGPTSPDTSKEEPQELELETIKKIFDALPTTYAPLKKQFEYILTQRELPSAEAIGHDMQTTFKELEAAVNGLATWNPQLQSALVPMLTAAKSKAKNWQEAYDQTLHEIEQWFNDSMDRVNGWYGRSSRMIIFIIAILITLLFNVDTLAIGSTLYTNSALRLAVVNGATAYVQQAEATNTTITTTATITGTTGNPQPEITANEQPAPANPSNPKPTLKELQTQIISLGLPIGWVIEKDYQCGLLDALLCMTDFQQLTQPITSTTGITTTARFTPTVSPPAIVNESQRYPVGANQLAQKLAGLALTIIALSLGAPFWFDALKQLVNVRSSGKAPTTTSNTSSTSS